MFCFFGVLQNNQAVRAVAHNHHIAEAGALRAIAVWAILSFSHCGLTADYGIAFKTDNTLALQLLAYIVRNGGGLAM